jgi:hypothetical protein
MTLTSECILVRGSTLAALPLHANIRLGWKWLAMTNALAYNGTVVITAVKSLYYRPVDGALLDLKEMEARLEGLRL